MYLEQTTSGTITDTTDGLQNTLIVVCDRKVEMGQDVRLIK